MVARPPSGTIPDAPGSYQFRDGDGRIIYVGKAKSLRNRLSNYFQKNLPTRTAQMVRTAQSVEWIQVDNELEALMLEYSLIKQHRPRFNIRLVDDKSYPFLAVTESDEWPRAMVMRGRKKKGTRYFGPFGHAYAIRETLDLLLRTFPIRTCSDNKLGRHEKLGRPCLLFHIEKCAGPCVGEISKEDYDELVRKLVAFLDGETDEVLRELDVRMALASDNYEYELAARIRDQIGSVRKAIEKQQIVGSREDDFDVIGVVGDELESAVQIFFIRRGRVVGRRGFVIDRVEDLDEPELIDRILEGVYSDEPVVGYPKQVLVPTPSSDPELYSAWLGELRGSKVDLRVPLRGGKRALLETVTRNAQESFTRHRLKRATDHNSRARALKELQEHLQLEDAPLRIECYDMSHIQGTDYVGSMVVVEDGLPKKSDYRRFKIKTVEGNNDFAAMAEVLERRLTNYLMDREKPVEERGRFAYPPNLIVVDGGKGQLSASLAVLRQLGLEAEIPIVSLAKQFEEVFIPGQSEPIRIPRQSEALYLLQRIRDESHRFAITYHRQLRGRRMTTSALDGIPGLGPTRTKRLIKEFGGVNAVKKASEADLLSLSWLPDDVATNVHKHLHAP
ncbi:MAG: excinuclease ABC subunit UvrC [Acidimicrobiales bacterium]|nr:excinuclease ABC subunit UvrC [Acidimicrobiales bacterium]